MPLVLTREPAADAAADQVHEPGPGREDGHVERLAVDLEERLAAQPVADPDRLAVEEVVTRLCGCEGLLRKPEGEGAEHGGVGPRPGLLGERRHPGRQPAEPLRLRRDERGDVDPVEEVGVDPARHAITIRSSWRRMVSWSAIWKRTI